MTLQQKKIWRFTAGEWLKILTLAGSIFWAYSQLSADVDALKERRESDRLEYKEILSDIKSDIKDLKQMIMDLHTTKPKWRNQD